MILGHHKIDKQKGKNTHFSFVIVTIKSNQSFPGDETESEIKNVI